MTDIDILFAGVAVADFDTAVAWYARLLGRPADADGNTLSFIEVTNSGG